MLILSTRWFGKSSKPTTPYQQVTLTDQCDPTLREADTVDMTEGSPLVHSELF